MALTRKEKNVLYEQMLSRLQGAELALFASFKGLPAADLFDAKKKIKGEKAFFQIVKNTLLKKAFSNMGIEIQDAALWKGETALLMSSDGDLVRLAKALVDWSMQNKNVMLKGGVLTEKKKWLTVGEVKTLAALPGTQELRGQIVFLLAGPLISLQQVLNAVTLQLVMTLKTIQRSKEEKSNASHV